MLIPLVALGFIFFGLKSNANESSSEGNKMKERLYNLPDIDPDDQGGNYKRDFDYSFEAAADKYGVPFALLKAESITESSLNPKAFLNENPKNLSDRSGWSSRGLMQLLYWPNSTRFQKYGFISKTGEELFDPSVNIDIAAQLIRDNLKACNGNVRDAINMYNTGRKESQLVAPNNYVNKTIGYYETLIKRKVT